MSKAIATGKITDQAAALTRVMGGDTRTRTSTIEFELAGSAGVAWDDDDRWSKSYGIGFLTRQTATIAGGTTEMSRNVISERVLGMPASARWTRTSPSVTCPARRAPTSPAGSSSSESGHLSRTRETDPEVPAAQEAGGAGTWGNSSWKAPMRIRWLMSAGQSSKSSWRVFWVCPKVPS